MTALKEYMTIYKTGRRKARKALRFLDMVIKRAKKYKQNNIDLWW